jgi:hypothetical protein
MRGDYGMKTALRKLAYPEPTVMFKNGWEPGSEREN